MQMCYGLWRRCLVDLAYLKKTVVKCIPSGVIHAKETPFSTKHKEVKDNYHTGHQRNNFYLKSYQTPIQLCTLVYWLDVKWSTSSENFAGRFRLPPQPNGSMKNYPMLRPGYRIIRFLDTKCTVGILKM